MITCPYCGQTLDDVAKFCNKCGRELPANLPSTPQTAPQTASSTPSTPTVPPYQQSSPQPAPSTGGPPVKASDYLSYFNRVTDRLPLVENVVFWLAINAFVLAFSGVSDLIFHRGPSFVLSCLGVLLAAGYVIVARRRYLGGASWAIGFSIVVPFLVIIGDLIATGGTTGLSVMIDVSSFLLIYSAYGTMRREARWRRGGRSTKNTKMSSSKQPVAQSAAQV